MERECPPPLHSAQESLVEQGPSLSSLGETGDGPAMTEFEGEMGPYEDDRIDSP
jgi:hypothetical protein